MSELKLKKSINDYEDPKEQMAFLSGQMKGKRILLFHIGCLVLSLVLVGLDASKLVDYNLYECMLPVFIAAATVFASTIVSLGTILSVIFIGAINE